MKQFLIGHAQNQWTGVSVVIAPNGAVAGVDVRGGAPGTRETDLIKTGMTVQKINAVALCGGSAWGLNACQGVMRYLYEHNQGYKTANHLVPIVAGAVLYDLNDKELHYPTDEMGYEACVNAIEDNKARGKVGAGTGATIGKILGPKHCMPSGLGTATVKVGGATVTAIVAVNAVGDVYDCNTNKILAGARLPLGGFLDTNKMILKAPFSAKPTNTTICVIMTDAKLTRMEANKIASLGHNGYALAIKPVHTTADGDTVFVMADGDVRIDVNQLGVGAIEAVRLAILNSIDSSYEFKPIEEQTTEQN